jgi:hypothetical protein
MDPLAGSVPLDDTGQPAQVLDTPAAVDRLLAGDAILCLGDPLKGWEDDRDRQYCVAQNGTSLWYRCRGYDWSLGHLPGAQYIIEGLRGWPATHEWIVVPRPQAW